MYTGLLTNDSLTALFFWLMCMLQQMDLMRHGEPLGGKRDRGQFDDPLSDKGWAKMRTTVKGCTTWDALIYIGNAGGQGCLPSLRPGA